MVVFGVVSMGVALYYQYAVGDQPCQVCIHARLWVCAIIVIGIVMALLPQSRPLRLLGGGALASAGLGLAERARYLYRLENGIGDGSCEFRLGMPGWFAVDRWVPWLFEVRNLCSYTPELLFGVSMAEALLVAGVGLCLLAIGVAALDLKRPQAAG